MNFIIKTLIYIKANKYFNDKGIYRHIVPLNEVNIENFEFILQQTINISKTKKFKEQIVP